ncbi:hypothetical protein EYM_07095 [Ignicoccus islandicus DSM 13165]|uniref:Uncharacterized protein n=1 Tax=Ignicoccus islandicus DSM 13165 TaxID=940295 RepID=A0A0U3EBP4_9CREN|nr:DUF99 family protein [Ignicoccus islandicus]ALU12750.1 hypothetical protein EYM_07095 [Ignicoccus islandicus DSM 13165]
MIPEWPKSLASFDDGKFTKELCPVVIVKTEGFPPDVIELAFLRLYKDPGDVTGLINPFLKNVDLILIDSITICGLGFVDPSNFPSKAVIVSKFVPNIRKAYEKAYELYGNDRFREVAEEYLKRVKCVKLKHGKICIAPYGLEFEYALKIVRKRTLVDPLPEEVRLSDSVASALGKWLNG